jgi:hypothetical protein
VNVGKGGNLSVATATEWVINGESFVGTLTTNSLSITARAAVGSVAANHAQGDTVWMPGINSVSNTTASKALVTLTGGKMKLSNCSFGWFCVVLTNGQLVNVSRIFTVGGNNIGSTTANVTIDRWCNNSSPTTEGASAAVWGQQITAVFGDLSVSNSYAASTCYNGVVVYSTFIDSNQSIVLSENFDCLLAGNRSVSSASTLNFSTNIFKTFIKNLTSVGGRIRFGAQNSFEVEGIKYGDSASGITSASYQSAAISVSNCQKVVLRNIRKTNGGASPYAGFIVTDASCADVMVHDVIFDGQGVMGTQAMSGLKFAGFSGEAEMRKTDHQLQQNVYISEWRKADAKNTYNVEKTGFNFQEVRAIPAYVASTPTSCQMKRPGA